MSPSTLMILRHLSEQKRMEHLSNHGTRVGSVPCAEIYPAFFDYGKKPRRVLAKFTAINCGREVLTVSAFNFAGSPSFAAGTQPPLYILQGGKRFGFMGSCSRPRTRLSSREDRVTFSIITNVRLHPPSGIEILQRFGKRRLGCGW